MVTRVPGGPDVGVKLDTVGMTRNAVELVPVPEGEETVTGPVSAPNGTLALTWVGETTENVAAVPSNATSVAPVNPCPSIVTSLPTLARGGDSDEIVGGGGGGRGGPENTSADAPPI